MVNHTFELNVDQWKFVGHPFSVQHGLFDIKFNIAFIVEVNTEPYDDTCTRIYKSMYSMVVLYI